MNGKSMIPTQDVVTVSGNDLRGALVGLRDVEAHALLLGLKLPDGANVGAGGRRSQPNDL
jgi:hypothetical protein